MKTCKYWQNVGASRGGFCKSQRHTVSFGVCAACVDNTQGRSWAKARIRCAPYGAGDRLELAFKVFGIDRAAKWLASRISSECGCQSRKDRMNQDGFVGFFWNVVSGKYAERFDGEVT